MWPQASHRCQRLALLCSVVQYTSIYNIDFGCNGVQILSYNALYVVESNYQKHTSISEIHINNIGFFQVLS
jgi:hypothetical protein